MFEEGPTSHRTVLFWFAKLRSRDFSLENESRGRPKHEVNNYELNETETQPKIKQLSKEAHDYCLTEQPRFDPL